MKSCALWISFVLTLAIVKVANAQAVAAEVAPGSAAPAPMAPAQAVPCSPACAPNQVCASNGQCMQLVPMVPYAFPEPLPPQPTTRRRSAPMMISGIVLTGVGGMFAIVGLVYWGMGSLACSDSTSTSDGSSCATELKAIRNAGRVMAVGGGIMATVGIPLIIVGAKRVPLTDANDGTSTAAAHRYAPQAEVVIGPGALSLRGSF
jgi:hypothetical protein